MRGSLQKNPTEALERAVEKYQRKLSRASNPTQRNYASSMLRSAQKALDESRDRHPVVEPEEGAISLDKSEYSIS